MYIPLLLTLTYSVLFLDYVLDSIRIYFPMKMKEKYLIYKRIITVLFTIYWLIEFPTLSLVSYEDKYCDRCPPNFWYDAFQYIFIIFCILVSIITVPIVVLFLKSLRCFPNIYNAKKIPIFLVIIGAGVQIITKAINSFLMIKNIWDSIIVKDYIYHSAQMCYLIISEIFPLFTYIFYLVRDHAQLFIVEMTEVKEDPTHEYVSATLIEDHLAKYYNGSSESNDLSRKMINEE